MSKRKTFVPLLAFFVVFVAHAAWAISRGPAACTGEAAKEAEGVCLGVLEPYIENQDYFLSFSYALLAAFTCYALLNLVENRKRAIAAASGGLLLTGGLYAVTCFAIGCCGSPMLAVYLGFLGSRLAGFEKPLLAGVTTASVALGWWWCRRCCPKDAPCCPSGLPCNPPPPGEGS